MKPIILNTRTGDRRDCSAWCDVDFTVDWWAFGNGSCDCNRELAFYREGDPEDEEDHEHCVAERYLIVGATGDLGGLSEAEVVAMVNSEYPPDLLKKFIPG